MVGKCREGILSCRSCFDGESAKLCKCSVNVCYEETCPFCVGINKQMMKQREKMLKSEECDIKEAMETQVNTLKWFSHL